MRKLLTFEILVHLSDRDFFKVLAEVDAPTILRAYKNVEPKYLEHLRRVFDDQCNSSFTKDLELLGEVKVEDSQAARLRIAEIADRLLTEDDMEDWHLRQA